MQFLSPPLVFTQHNQRDKYKDWTESRIAKALEAVNSQGLTIRRAAEEFDIPKSTLHDRASGRVLAGATSGPPQYLTDEEEDELEAFLSGAAKLGYAQSRQQVIQLVQEAVNKKGMKVTVTHGW